MICVLNVHVWDIWSFFNWNSPASLHTIIWCTPCHLRFWCIQNGFGASVLLLFPPQAFPIDLYLGISVLAIPCLLLKIVPIMYLMCSVTGAIKHIIWLHTYWLDESNIGCIFKASPVIFLKHISFMLHTFHLSFFISSLFVPFSLPLLLPSFLFHSELLYSPYHILVFPCFSCFLIRVVYLYWESPTPASRPRSGQSRQ